MALVPQHLSYTLHVEMQTGGEMLPKASQGTLKNSADFLHHLHCQCSPMLPTEKAEDPT